jgi:peroxiredoxin
MQIAQADICRQQVQDSGRTTELKSSRGSIAMAGILLLIVSVTLNVLLAHKIHSVIRFLPKEVSTSSLKVGTSVPPITGTRSDGQSYIIRYSGSDRPTVLYIFTPTCVWCARNMDNFKTMVDKEGSRYRVIGLSLSQEGLAQYLSKNELKLPVYSGLSDETKRIYKLSGTPQTIVISPEGKVLEDWVGAWAGDQKSQVEAFFHVALPGIQSLQHPQ